MIKNGKLVGAGAIGGGAASPTGGAAEGGGVTCDGASPARGAVIRGGATAVEGAFSGAGAIAGGAASPMGGAANDGGTPCRVVRTGDAEVSQKTLKAAATSPAAMAVRVIHIFEDRCPNPDIPRKSTH